MQLRAMVIMRGMIADNLTIMRR